MAKKNIKIKSEMVNGTRLYECTSCHNTWSLQEGFRIETGQCAGCQKWDDDKPKRDAEEKRRLEFENTYTGFPYVPGDPFW